MKKHSNLLQGQALLFANGASKTIYSLKYQNMSRAGILITKTTGCSPHSFRLRYGDILNFMSASLHTLALARMVLIGSFANANHDSLVRGRIAPELTYNKDQ